MKADESRAKPRRHRGTEPPPARERNRVRCQAIEANGSPTTAPSAGVPSSTILGPFLHNSSLPGSPKIVAGGTHGERVGERPPRVSGRRRDEQAGDSASCGRAGHDVSGSFIRGKSFVPWAAKRHAGLPRGARGGEGAMRLRRSHRTRGFGRAGLCASVGPSFRSREQDTQPLGGAHGVRLRRLGGVQGSSDQRPATRDGGAGGPATSDQRPATVGRRCSLSPVPCHRRAGDLCDPWAAFTICVICGFITSMGSWRVLSVLRVFAVQTAASGWDDGFAGDAGVRWRSLS
jgi:hypothetical protein